MRRFAGLVLAGGLYRMAAPTIEGIEQAALGTTNIYSMPFQGYGTWQRIGSEVNRLSLALLGRPAGTYDRDAQAVIPELAEAAPIFDPTRVNMPGGPFQQRESFWARLRRMGDPYGLTGEQMTQFLNISNIPFGGGLSAIWGGLGSTMLDYTMQMGGGMQEALSLSQAMVYQNLR